MSRSLYIPHISYVFRAVFLTLPLLSLPGAVVR